MRSYGTKTIGKAMTTGVDFERQEKREVATRIAEYLFTNGQRCLADTLVLTTKHGSNIGGWGKPSVVDVIFKHLDGTL